MADPVAHLVLQRVDQVDAPVLVGRGEQRCGQAEDDSRAPLTTRTLMTTDQRKLTINNWAPVGAARHSPE